MERFGLCVAALEPIHSSKALERMSDVRPPPNASYAITIQRLESTLSALKWHC